MDNEIHSLTYDALLIFHHQLQNRRYCRLDEIQRLSSRCKLIGRDGMLIGGVLGKFSECSRRSGSLNVPHHKQSTQCIHDFLSNGFHGSLSTSTDTS
jgi:hypothetical protein